MAWNAGKHPRAQAGSAAGGQFTVASSSSSSKPKKQTSSSKKKAAAKPKAAAKKRSGKTVTVKRGDTLSAIARRSGESLAQLKKDNPGLFSKKHHGGNLIFAGNKVKVRAATKKRSSKTKKSSTVTKTRSQTRRAKR